MQYLPFLLAFIAGSIFTILFDRAASKMRRIRARRYVQAKAAMARQLEAEGWQRPWLS